MFKYFISCAFAWPQGVLRPHKYNLSLSFYLSLCVSVIVLVHLCCPIPLEITHGKTILNEENNSLLIRLVSRWHISTCTTIPFIASSLHFLTRFLAITHFFFRIPKKKKKNNSKLTSFINFQSSKSLRFELPKHRVICDRYCRFDIPPIFFYILFFLCCFWPSPWIDFSEVISALSTDVIHVNERTRQKKTEIEKKSTTESLIRYFDSV